MRPKVDIVLKIAWRALPAFAILIGTLMVFRYVVINILHFPFSYTNGLVVWIFVVSLLSISYGSYAAVMKIHHNKDVLADNVDKFMTSPGISKSIFLFIGLIIIPIVFIIIYYVLVLFYSIIWLKIFGVHSGEAGGITFSVIALVGAITAYCFMYKIYFRNNS